MEGLAGLVVDFIQLLHGTGVPVQEVKPGIDHGTPSFPEGRHSEEARRQVIIVLDTHGTYGIAMRQLPVPDASCGAQVPQVRALTLR